MKLYITIIELDFWVIVLKLLLNGNTIEFSLPLPQWEIPAFLVIIIIIIIIA
jgi:hypothetical protein